MAFSDPQSVTFDGAAKSLPRTGAGATSGLFRSADQKFRLVIAHNTTKGGRVQHVARLELADIVANPLVPSTNSAITAAATFTVNQPSNGLDAETIKDLAAALVAWATEGNLVKLVTGES